MKQIYIILAHTGTLLSRLIKIRTGEEYTHSSIALNDSLKVMYSFGRLNPYNPFIGGFVEEGADFGTYKRFYNTEISVYEVNVTDEQYELISNEIKIISLNRKKFKFNLKGLFLAGFNMKTKGNNTYYCAEFVKHILEVGKVDISNIPEVIKPEHFKMIKDGNLVYKGLLSMYKYQHLVDNMSYLLRRKFSTAEK